MLQTEKTCRVQQVLRFSGGRVASVTCKAGASGLSATGSQENDNKTLSEKMFVFSYIPMFFRGTKCIEVLYTYYP